MPSLTLPKPLRASPALLALGLLAAVGMAAGDADAADDAHSAAGAAPTHRAAPPVMLAMGEASGSIIQSPSWDESLRQPARRGNPDTNAQLERRRRLAQSALMRNHPAEALALADAALQDKPHDARLLFLKGVALNQLKRLDEAETVFMALVDEYPELPEPYNNLAVVRAAQGKLEQAREALEASIRTVPGYTIAHENLGDLYLQLAIRNWQHALQQTPDNTALKKKLEQLQAIAPPPSGLPHSTTPPAGR